MQLFPTTGLVLPEVPSGGVKDFALQSTIPARGVVSRLG